jgi:CRP-like cAMP-binding protein
LYYQKIEGKITKREKKISTFDEVITAIPKKRIIKLHRNEHLYIQNESIKGLYYLITGKIKVVQKDKDEKYNILHSIKGPDIIGLSSLLCDEVHTNSAYSVEESNILFIPKKEFLEILSRNNKMAMDLMKMLCIKIDKTEARIPQINC